MKRCIALLLALLLPVCALSETIEVTVQVQTAEALFSAMLEPAVQSQAGLDDATAEAAAKLMKALIGNTKITTVTQEDAGSVSISLNGVNFLDVTTYLSGVQTLMTSSLIPGYVLVEEADPAADAQREKKIAEDVKAAVTAWKDGLTAETAYGAFSGDAYTGGTSCTTWTITDSDIAKLMSNLMTPELRTLVSESLTVEESEQTDVLDALEKANQRVAEENKYAYTIRCVKDDQNRIVGMSLTVFEHEKQLATLSLGLDEQEIRLVLGLGMKEQNYWSEYRLTKNKHEQTTYIKGEACEWVADKSESFTYVSQTNAPAASYLMNCVVTNYGKRNLWDGHIYLGAKADAAKEILTFTGSVNELTKSAEAKFSLRDSQQDVMTVAVSSKPVEAILMPDESMVRCSETEQAELYTKVNQEFVFALSMRLIQIIPFDVLLKMDGLAP